MGLSKFEKQIKDHQEYFEKDASMDHLEKFLFKLKEQEEKKKKETINWSQGSWWIGIAASLSLLISIAWFISQQPQELKQQQQMGLSFELYEIKSYYNNDSDKKLKQINSCSDMSHKSQKLIATTETQIMKLDYNVDKLEDKLKAASGNKKLELAYIQNLKAKNDLLNKMYQEICHNQNVLTQ